ncbi:uncharacterized protein [Patagioenas fasciata]|uniref:uncharacterized protein isoform X2 n=1 Tax=Patagioenas fasciata TaxID=372321 RepID=UPI003A9A1C9E
MEPGEKQNKDFIAFTLLGKKCPPKKLGITGSCPNLVMSKHEVHEEKGGEALQPGTHRSLCLVPSAGGDDSSSMLAPQDWQGALQVQMEVAESRGAAHSTESLVQTSISCAHRSPPLPCPVGSPSKTKLTSHFSLFSTLSSGSETDSSPMPPASSKKYLRGSWKKNSHPEEPTSLKPRGLACSLFTGPIIARITDCIYLGNLNAAYSGRALCTNSIDSIIDMSSLPSDCSLSVIPCTCQRGGFKHSWSRLKVDIQAPLHGDNHDMGQPCFRHINNCIEASLEKGKRVLIHCRDGYSLGPTCVIQYLMVKHSMRLLAAYELVRARYPLNIQECHQDLLVGLEMSLQPGSINIMCLKHSLSRKMAWS